MATLGCESGHVVAGPHLLDQAVLGHPVALAPQRGGIGLEALEAVLPHVEGDVLLGREAPAVPELEGPLEVLGLDVEGPHLAAVGQADPALAGDVVADLADGPDRVLERQVAQHGRGVLQHGQQDAGGAHLEEGGVLAHVGVAHDDVEAAEALGVGVRLVAGVDDGPAAGGGRRDPFPDVLGPLAEAEDGAPGRLEHLAGPGVDLPADQERDEHLGVAVELVVALGQVVLVAAVGVADRVGVVLEEVDLAADALLAQAGLGAGDQLGRGSTPPPCRGSRRRRSCRTRAWRTRGGCPHRGRGGPRSPGRRWRSGPS